MSNWWEIIIPIITSLVGLFGIAAGLNGNLFERIPMLLRIVLIAGGLALMVPESITDVIGIAIIVAVFVIQYGMARKSRTGKEPPTGE